MWEVLFKKALRILDISGIPESEWAFGGGSALALYLQHRESKDVDIFLTDAQYLTLLTPRLNRMVSRMTSDYAEGSSFLKLRFPEGEIDFIIAPHLTQGCCEIKEIAGRSVQVETPEEIVLKKLFYRAETLKIRDVVDTAAVFEKRRGQLLENASLLASRIESLKRRWEKLKKSYCREASGLRILDPRLAEKAPTFFDSFLQEAEKLSDSTAVKKDRTSVQRKLRPKI
ncbi:MAG TPA: nucleotidyl transferase AbiEii/AbiGii toxin family protein [Syntrophomonadaceae bacterium]|nr:nucleotidyl transferase AbiEii/AbiGii toxin family protein [Syntrophomonadaceae bacterium]